MIHIHHLGLALFELDIVAVPALVSHWAIGISELGFM